ARRPGRLHLQPAGGFPGPLRRGPDRPARDGRRRPALWSQCRARRASLLRPGFL
ncbi:uncharacterized protein METZ01_LOCUS247257, partial [marine metagenome]